MGDIPEPDAAVAMPEPPSWLTLRVFCLRLSRCEVDESMLGTLTLIHTPLTPDTVLEASGVDQQLSNGTVSCSLRRDRVDARAEEATFVSRATVRVAGSVRFEVQNGDERLLVGILEMCDAESAGGGDETTAKEMKKKSWVMKCQVATQRGSGFLRSGRERGAKPPAVEVYVAGVFRGTPIVFTKAMQVRFRRMRRQAKAFMDPIPECGEQEEGTTEMALKHDRDEQEYRCYKPYPDGDGDGDGDDSLYLKSEGLEGEEYSELSWFTAGVRVGVGISLGICLGVGIGAGLLVRSYQSTSRTLTRRLITKLL
ncbi:hypothetical protein ACP70R_013769 [Stipagrostis hirtigluma subsp. patula]